jgi:hypothetical protein
MFLQPLSKSTYSTFEKCPWKAHAHKNLGIPSESSPAAELGVKAHELIAAILKGEISKEDIDVFAEDNDIAEMTRAAFIYFPIPEVETIQ